MNTHTQGPWTLRRHATNHQTLTGATAGLIADIHKDEDARLIAAAPDLLKALREAVEIIEGTGLDASTQREALQRATGEAVLCLECGEVKVWAYNKRCSFCDEGEGKVRV